LVRAETAIVAAGARSPAFDGASRHTDHRTRGPQSCAGCLRLVEQLHDHFSLSSSVSSSASSRQALYFFLENQERGGLRQRLLFTRQLALEIADAFGRRFRCAALFLE
jgi:hypothetical protein